MKLNINFNKKFELQRVKNTLSRIEWFNEQGYKVGLPKRINKKSSDEEISKQIAKEFNAKKFQTYSKNILNEFLEIEKVFHKELIRLFGKEIPKEYNLYLTSYGVGGSYILPDSIIKNINNSKGGIKTVVHEIIHLIIESNIQKYKVYHWEKERLVDLILNSDEFNFLDYDYWQGNYHCVEKYIDPLFNKEFFRDPSSFFSKIKKSRLPISKKYSKVLCVKSR